MVTKIWHTLFSNSRPLIKVCAWCPKANYPQLHTGEEYTHGLCRKHYRKLSTKKDLALSLLIAEFFEKTRSKGKMSFKKLHTTVRLHVQKISNISSHH